MLSTSFISRTNKNLQKKNFRQEGGHHNVSLTQREDKLDKTHFKNLLLNHEEKQFTSKQKFDELNSPKHTQLKPCCL